MNDNDRRAIGQKAGLTTNAQFGDGELNPTQAAELARLTAMLEVAFLAAAADGEISDQEADNLGSHLGAWLGTELPADTIEGIIEDFIVALDRDGRAARVAAIATTLDPESRRVAYGLACVVAMCDLELEHAELDVLGELATGLAIPQADAQAAFNQIKDHIETTIAAGR
jgi:tellurite resistance protein